MTEDTKTHNRNNHRNRNRQRDHRPEEAPKAESAEALAAAAVPAEPDEDAATAEEMEAFIRSRREQRNAKQGKRRLPEEEDDVPTNLEDNENAMDPYLEPDPTLPKVEYHEPLFLTRGCNHCPVSYVPIEEQELHSCCKVGSSNWMRGIRRPLEKPFDCVEVRFKNNRKEFYRLPDGIDVSDGDLVAVEGVPGHDVGIVSLTGEVCRIQMLKKKVNPESESIKKLFRRAKVSDIERWVDAIREEKNTLQKTRHIAEELGLVMKVNDVEYQGDKSKAIFYYTADDRVDFRNLIKVLAEQFHVRIEMKQIGVRQEAGKVGGIGTCGRELCCSTWLTNFKSVTTSVAKTQQILPNPQKLAGQCGKLKCCLNFEHAVYVDAMKKFPPAGIAIRFKKGLALYKKTDVFRGIMWYAYEGQSELYAMTAENVKALIEMNQRQEYAEQMEDYQVELMSTAALVQESSEAEFERELQQLADDGGKSSTEERHTEGKGQRERRDNRGPRGNHDNRDNRGPRPQRKGNEQREARGERDNREPRGERQRRDERRKPRNNGNSNNNGNEQ